MGVLCEKKHAVVARIFANPRKNFPSTYEFYPIIWFSTLISCHKHRKTCRSSHWPKQHVTLFTTKNRCSLVAERCVSSNWTTCRLTIAFHLVTSQFNMGTTMNRHHCHCSRSGSTYLFKISSIQALSVSLHPIERTSLTRTRHL